MGNEKPPDTPPVFSDVEIRGQKDLTKETAIVTTTHIDSHALPPTMTTATTVSTVNIAAQRAKVIAAFQALIDGINEELTDVKTLVINKQNITKAQLISDFQERLTAAENTKAARLAYHAAVAAEAQVAARVAPERAAVKLYLAARCGKSSPEMQKFGFTPAKTPQKTAASKAAGAAKARATRDALGTMGRKQKMAALALLAAAASATPEPAVSAVASSAAPSTTTSVGSPAAPLASSAPPTVDEVA